MLGHLGHIAGEARPPLDVGVDGVGGGFALLLSKDRLLFKKRGQELVGVLKRTQCQHACGVDLVKHARLPYLDSGSEEKESCSRLLIWV